MSEKDSSPEVIEFKGDNETKPTITTNPKVEVEKDVVKGEPVFTDSAVTATEAEKPKTEEPKPFTWLGVKFPAYFKGPHFIQIKGSIVLAIDPDCVSMEMRTNWQNIYVPELAALGKKIIEKHLKIKIEKLD